MKPHKHAEVLRAIADGKEVEYRVHTSAAWVVWRIDDCVDPIHYARFEWRIKPEPKPDNHYCFRAYPHSNIYYPPHFVEPTNVAGANLRLTFDGETGKLKTAEVL